MQTPVSGSSLIRLPELGLATGVLRSARDLWEPGNENELVAAIHLALDVGFNLIDMAPAHGAGLAEELVGKAILGRRDAAVLATKCGLLPCENGSDGYRRSLKPESIVTECEASLRRLRVETIDLYQCHWPDPETPIADTVAVLEKLVRQGKILTYGMANFGLSRLAAARERGRIATLQIPFSLLRREADDDLIPYCKKHGIRVLATDPLAGGVLADNHDEQISAMDHAPRSVIARLRALAAQQGWPLRKLALAWNLHHPGIAATLVPVRRPSDVHQAVAAQGLHLSETDLAEIGSALSHAS